MLETKEEILKQLNGLKSEELAEVAARADEILMERREAQEVDGLKAIIGF